MVRKTIIAILFVIFLTPNAKAQSASEDQFQPREALATIFYTGAFGAVLGLSTLSFVDQPSAHLKNIMIGGALGIILGVGYVAWEASTSSTPITDNLYQSNVSYKEMKIAGKSLMDLYDKSSGPSYYPGQYTFAQEPLQLGMRFTIPSI
jgi:hypothetical protein